MFIEPYKQSFTHSCLAACFFMLLKAQKGTDFDQDDERKLWESGSDRKHPFYVVGIPQEFSKTFEANVEICVGNKYFTNVLKKAFGSNVHCKVRHRKITIESIRERLKEGPVICHIDDHILGNYSHSSHFVILEKELSQERILIVDPWIGRKRRLRFGQIEESILSLKKHIKMCPLLLRILD